MTEPSDDETWRAIQVRSAVAYIEASIKTALGRYEFAPNDADTWTAVVATVSSFLQAVWSPGGLIGASEATSFAVECGEGSTMSPRDILEGYMIVQVTLQMIRPAEFIELTIKQKMETRG